MPFKKHKPEEIIGKLREVEIVLAQGESTISLQWGQCWVPIGGQHPAPVDSQRR